MFTGECGGKDQVRRVYHASVFLYFIVICMDTERCHIMPENIRISVVEIPCTTERYVYFAGVREASCNCKIV